MARASSARTPWQMRRPAAPPCLDPSRHPSPSPRPGPLSRRAAPRGGSRRTSRGRPSRSGLSPSWIRRGPGASRWPRGSLTLAMATPRPACRASTTGRSPTAEACAAPAAGACRMRATREPSGPHRLRAGAASRRSRAPRRSLRPRPCALPSQRTAGTRSPGASVTTGSCANSSSPCGHTGPRVARRALPASLVSVLGRRAGGSANVRGRAHAARCRGRTGTSRRTRRCHDGASWRIAAGRLSHATRMPRARGAWTRTRAGAGMAGLDIARWACSRRAFWRASAGRPPTRRAFPPAGERPSLPAVHRPPHALQSGHAGQTRQGPAALAPAALGPRPSAVTAGDDVAHGPPCPRLAHLLRAAIAPAACCSSSSRLSHKAREQRLASPQSAAGAWCAWWQTSRCPDRPSRDTPAGPLTQKALSGGLSGRETPPKLGNGAVYEISGLGVLLYLVLHRVSSPRGAVCSAWLRGAPVGDAWGSRGHASKALAHKCRLIII